MSIENNLLPASTETGKLGVMQLKRYWGKSMLLKAGKLAGNSFSSEWNIDNTLLFVLGLGLEQTIKYTYTTATDFDAFEDWILSINNGDLNEEKIAQFNAYITSRELPAVNKENLNIVLNDADLAHWEKYGYVIVRQAVSETDCQDGIDAICNAIGVVQHDATSWYAKHIDLQGIMVQLFQHPALEKNRRSPKIRAAFEQLWQRKDLWMNTDRAGFNPPETGAYKYQGHPLHWDVSVALPIPFGTQGLLYLSDTAANQGAFTLVPGFQHKIEKWLHELGPSVNPRQQDMFALGATPIAANAGDLIIWQQALPHGSSPNTASLPRFVQYINYAPLDAEINPEWK